LGCASSESPLPTDRSISNRPQTLVARPSHLPAVDRETYAPERDGENGVIAPPTRTRKRADGRGESARLLPGSTVRVRRIGDPWLRRYSGLLGMVVLQDDAVEVRFPGGARQFFLREEVEPVDDSVAVHVLSETGAAVRISGATLKAERQDVGMSQAAVARLLGVSQARLSAIEQKATVKPAAAAEFRSALAGAVRPPHAV
jgi:hypothetical protein